MLFAEARVGMQVLFGRMGARAERSLGEIVKCNPAKAKVKLLEERGTRSPSKPGTIWVVPYALMQPVNADSTKPATPKSVASGPIVPGETTFRSHYADSNPLWLVKARRGRDTWLCEIQNEPFTFDGKIYPSDFAGTCKAFLTKEILNSLTTCSLIENSRSQSDAFYASYASLAPGQTVHYRNGFDQWVRCTVVIDPTDQKPALKKVALVGNGWSKCDLPAYSRSGKIHYPFHAQGVIDGELFRPHASQIYESGMYSAITRWLCTDPSTLQPLSLTPEPLTQQEEANKPLWNQLERIKQIIETDTSDPGAALQQIREVLDSKSPTENA